MADSADDLQRIASEWNPGSEHVVDTLDLAPFRALAATLDVTPSGEELPAFWHWVYFLEWEPTAELAVDGHPRTSALVPPIPDRVRMFAGGRLEVRASLRLRNPAVRRSSVTEVVAKPGRTGQMLFVKVRNEIEQNRTLAVLDEQDIMYRSGAVDRAFGPSGAPRADEPWQESFTPGEALLFRFSALTGNTHRIHYDHPFTTGVERYPGIVVHGPLLAIRMAQAANRHADGRRIRTMTYRFLRPCFVGDELLVVGQPLDEGGARMKVVIGDHQLVAQADVEFSPT